MIDFIKNVGKPIYNFSFWLAKKIVNFIFKEDDKND